MASRLHPVATGFEAVQLDRVVADEVIEDTDGVGSPSDAGRDIAGQATMLLQHLLAGLGGDDPLQLPHQQREGVGAADGAYQVVGGVHGGHPVAHGLVHGILQSAGAGRDGVDLSAQQLHPGDIEGLPSRVDLSHIDAAFKPQQGGGRGGRNPMLTGTGLRDHPPFAHPPGQQRLPEHVVDLVGASVVEILALEVDGRIPAVPGEILSDCHRRRPAGVVALQPCQLRQECGICLGGTEFGVQLGQCSTQSLRHECSAKTTEVALGVGKSGHGRNPTGYRSRHICSAADSGDS